jgi:uncharacterized membrane protein YfhO
MTWDKTLDISSTKKVSLVQPTENDFLIAKFFSKKEGAEVLEILKSMTIDRPVLHSYFNDGVNTSLSMALREGENNFVRQIFSIIKKVNKYGHRQFNRE